MSIQEKGDPESSVVILSARSRSAVAPRRVPPKMMTRVLRRGEAARYDETVIARGIREFVSRDWGAVRDAKNAYWGERIARLGSVEAFRIGDELRRQALLQHPGWPHPDDRRRDLQSHSRLADLLRRAAPARRR